MIIEVRYDVFIMRVVVSNEDRIIGVFNWTNVPDRNETMNICGQIERENCLGMLDLDPAALTNSEIGCNWNRLVERMIPCLRIVKVC